MGIVIPLQAEACKSFLTTRMKQKILTFVVCGKKLLVLHSKPHLNHREGGWFVVTGAIENEESPENAVKREVKEETDLDVEEVFNLNWGSVYEWRNEIYEETNLIAFVNEGKVKLNEEHNKFRWMGLDKFVDIIRWDDDKRILKEVLKMAIKKEKYFKEKEIKDYRKDNSKVYK